jgi:acyl transferase
VKTDLLIARTSDDRRVAIWRTESLGPPRKSAVICPGFGRRMRHVGPIALYLAQNGVVTYRFDPVDHLGLSDGTIRDFSLEGTLESLRVTFEHLLKRESVETGTVVTASLSARAAFRFAANNPHVDKIIGLVGVVNVADTIRRALGIDYSDVALTALPDHVDFEGHQIDPRWLWWDHNERDWGSLQGTIDDLAKVSCPVVNFAAQADEWVDSDDLRKAFEIGGGGPRRIFELPYGEHDLSQNPAAVRVVLGKLTDVLLQDEVSELDCLSPDLVEPSFDEIVELIVAERELESMHRDELGQAD